MGQSNEEVRPTKRLIRHWNMSYKISKERGMETSLQKGWEEKKKRICLGEVHVEFRGEDVIRNRLLGSGISLKTSGFSVTL